MREASFNIRLFDSDISKSMDEDLPFFKSLRLDGRDLGFE